MKPIVTETRTAIINAAHDAQIVIRPIHDLGDHDVLIKILSCNLCTSEYGLWSGARTNKPLPMTFGHEWAGEIIQVGERVSGLAVGDFVGAWKDMEKAVKMGKVRAIGISNFDANDEVFNEIMEKSTIKPAVLQIECHPYAQRVEMRKKAAKYGIQVECWYPLGGAQSQGLLLRDPVIKKIAEAHGKSPAQIILRWHIQEGFSVIPGATNPDYIKENIQIFDFALTDNEMQQIRSLNKEQRIFNASMEDVKRMIWGTKL